MYLTLNTGRKDFTSKLGDSIKPDSQKTTTEKLGDSASGAYDRVAGAVQPEYALSTLHPYSVYTNPNRSSQKSMSQGAADNLRGGSDQAQRGGKGVMDSISDTVSGATQSAKETISSMTGQTSDTRAAAERKQQQGGL